MAAPGMLPKRRYMCHLYRKNLFEGTYRWKVLEHGATCELAREEDSDAFLRRFLDRL